MQRKQFKSQASSARVSGGAGFGSTFGAHASPLSYAFEAPDLTPLSDPNVAVTFKNLMKKDSTTKAKALEELQTYLSTADTDIEEAFLAAWVKLYPRLTIDNTRRVRQLSYTVNGQIASKCGKRIVPYMHNLAAPWLSGTYDADRGVAKAAQDALKQTFNTPEKLQNVSKVFHKDIAEYCRNVVENETEQTLSDERTVSKDDAEATYARVVATSLAVLSNLVSELPFEELDKQKHIYEEFLGQDKLWNFSWNKDVAIRRAVLRLLRNCVDKETDVLQQSLQSITKAIIDKALHADQTGSATDLLQTLISLTTAFPTIWTSDYVGKKSVDQRIRQCIKRGSQSSPPDYWLALGKLLLRLQPEVICADLSGTQELFKTLRQSVTHRDERFNASSAWSAYFNIIDHVCTSTKLSDTERDDLLGEHVLTVVDSYLTSSSGTDALAPSGSKAATNVAKATSCRRSPQLLIQKWPQYSTQLVEEMKTSLPEQAKEFEKSQMAVAAYGQRWIQVQIEILRDENAIGEQLSQIFQQEAAKVVTEAIELLRTRNGKPYGAAAIIDELCGSGSIVTKQSTSHKSIVDFMSDYAPHHLLSPSQTQLFSILYKLHGDDEFDTIWNKFANALADVRQSPEGTNAFRKMLASPGLKLAGGLVANNEQVQSFLQDESRSLVSGDHDSTFVTSILKHSPAALSSATRDQIMSGLLASLTVQGQARAALLALDQINNTNKSLVESYMSSSNGSKILPQLLLLEESPDDEVAEKASELSNKLVKGSTPGQAPPASFELIQQGLINASSSTLPVRTLLEMGDRLLEQSGPEAAKSMLPDLQVWESALSPFLSRPTMPSLAIMNQLGGTVLLNQEHENVKSAKVSRDVQGYSQALRFAMFVQGTFSKPTNFEVLDDDQKIQILYLLQLVVLLVNDNLSINQSNSLWAAHTPDVEVDMIEFVSSAQALINKWLKANNSFVSAASDRFLSSSSGMTPAALYNARAYSSMQSELFDIHGADATRQDQVNELFQQYRKGKDTFPLCGTIAAYQQVLWTHGSLKRYCNELVADITGADALTRPVEVQQRLVTLNTILHGQELADGDIAKQRLVFFVKHVLPWLANADVSISVKAETCKSLALLLPSMSDMYGEHWSQAMGAVLAIWKKSSLSDASTYEVEAGLYLLHSSLRLFGTLRSLKSGEDANDDLLDVWKANQKDAAKSLIALLTGNQITSDEAHQPLKIINDLISREINKLPPVNVEDVSELYPLLYAPSESIQQTAFDLLHRQIPAAQEQISFDAALENKATHLPEELLSLVLEAPTLDSIADKSFERSMPLDLRGYLYSWLLIFDHFNNSSYKVKTDYINNLKDGDYLSPLLEFTFDFLGHSNGKSVDASKFDIANYTAGTESSPEKDTQCLLTYAYYLSLTHIASLTKTYFLSVKSRQTSQAVSSWTSKHISPLITSNSLNSVVDWAAAASSDPEHEGFEVKVSTRSKEVQVSYMIDEQKMAIVVKLPDEYPLQGAKVEGVNRVAVDEKRWQSWIRNCQGVITFSNGNLIDGLNAWRKNVSGVLKGQTECAICYSVVSSDKQLPSKRCLVCKNLFHASCLFKWFKSSNASTCPLCRNAFNYG